jgi:hypothetical protein
MLTLLSISSVFCSYFVFDTLGDSHGWRVGLGVAAALCGIANSVMAGYYYVHVFKGEESGSFFWSLVVPILLKACSRAFVYTTRALGFAFPSSWSCHEPEEPRERASELFDRTRGLASGKKNNRRAPPGRLALFLHGLGFLFPEGWPCHVSVQERPGAASVGAASVGASSQSSERDASVALRRNKSQALSARRGLSPSASMSSTTENPMRLEIERGISILPLDLESATELKEELIRRGP